MRKKRRSGLWDCGWEFSLGLVPQGHVELVGGPLTYWLFDKEQGNIVPIWFLQIYTLIP